MNDISLLDLFLMETAQHCRTLNQQLDSAAIDYGELHRALHSIKGAARIINLTSVIRLTASLENALRSSPEFTEKNTGLQKAVTAGIKQLDKISVLKAEELRPTIRQDKNIFRNIIANLDLAAEQNTDETADDKLPAEDIPGSGDINISHDLFEIFREDTRSHLAVLTDNIIKLEKTPNDSLLIEDSMRAAHSIKGAARIIELHEIVKIAHAMEDILLDMQQQNAPALSPAITDNLLTGCDLLNNLIQIPLETLDTWLNHNKTLITDIWHLLTSPPAESTDSPDSTGVTAPAAKLRQAAKNTPHSGKDRSIRVSSRNMNRLMRLAGEAIVEAGWLPEMMKNTLRLKNKQDEIWSEINNIHKRMLDQGMPAYMEDTFSYLNRRIKYCQDFMAGYIADVDDHVRNFSNISHRLQQEVIANRMQPFSEGIKGLPRLIRDLSRRQNKNIRLEVKGAETQIDRDIMEKLEAPLTHIITNAVDHGIESPEVREKTGKPTEATIRVTARHAQGQLYITISDDGGGVNFDHLRRKIIDNELVSEKMAVELKESELLEFLFLPNFSTKSTLSESSGRGVGLDVVHTIIRQVRGSIEVSSEPGYGSYFELRLPLTLSIIRSIVTQINDEPYAFPLVSVDHVITLDRSEIKELEGRQYIISHNKRIGIIPAQQVLDLEDQDTEKDTFSIIVLENTNNPYGLIVDQLQGIRDLVVQPLTRLGKLRSINAASIAEDGTPILILDIQDLITTMDHLISGNHLQPLDMDEPCKPPPGMAKTSHKRILVVDDSITVREVERSLLTRHGFEVDVAADGIDAWNLIKQGNYALIITDVDMPQMDGIELLCQIRESQEFEELPVIIVSYKDREEDKNRGLDAGADYYLTKGSFTDSSLIEAVEDLLGVSVP